MSVANSFASVWTQDCVFEFGGHGQPKAVVAYRAESLFSVLPDGEVVFDPDDSEQD